MSDNKQKLQNNLRKLRGPKLVKDALTSGDYTKLAKGYKKITTSPSFDKTKSLADNSNYNPMGNKLEKRSYDTLELIDKIFKDLTYDQAKIDTLMELNEVIGGDPIERSLFETEDYARNYEFTVSPPVPAQPVPPQGTVAIQPPVEEVEEVEEMAGEPKLRGSVETKKAIDVYKRGIERRKQNIKSLQPSFKSIYSSEQELLQDEKKKIEQRKERAKQLDNQFKTDEFSKLEEEYQEFLNEQPIEAFQEKVEEQGEEEGEEEKDETREEERQETKEEEEVVEEIAEELAENPEEKKVATEFVGDVLQKGKESVESQVSIDVEREVDKRAEEYPEFTRDEIRETILDIYRKEYPNIKLKEAKPSPPPPAEATDKPEPRRIKETIVPRDPQPSLLATVPPERLGITGKSVDQIKDDIEFFLKQFPQQTKSIRYNRRSRGRRYVESIHKRIVAKLRGSPPMGEKKIGVVISGEDFIKDKLKEIIMENSIQGLTAQDLIINIEGKPKEETGKDAGAYEIKRTVDGKESAQREPVYRYIPEVQPEKKMKRGKIPTPQTKYRNQEQTAKRQFRNDPFRSKQPSIRLKYLY